VQVGVEAADDPAFEDGDGVVGSADAAETGGGLILQNAEVVVLDVDGCGGLALVGRGAQQVGGGVELAAATVAVVDHRPAAGLLLGGQSGDLRVDAAGSVLGGGGQLDDGMGVVGQVGDIGADEQVGGHLVVASGLGPLAGPGTAAVICFRTMESLVGGVLTGRAPCLRLGTAGTC